MTSTAKMGKQAGRVTKDRPLEGGAGGALSCRQPASGRLSGLEFEEGVSVVVNHCFRDPAQGQTYRFPIGTGGKDAPQVNYIHSDPSLFHL